jgi:hypothetical protein
VLDVINPAVERTMTQTGVSDPATKVATPAAQGESQ